MDISLSRHAARFVPALIACLTIVGCDSSTTDIRTAPSEESSEALSALTPGAGVVIGSTLGSPLADLSADELTRFAEGEEEFQAVETIEEGLGPVFNEASCSTCHDAPLGGTTGRLETRFGRWNRGRFDPLANLGGSLIQDRGIGRVPTATGVFKFVAEVVPRIANARTPRLTTPLFGLGLVDAVPDETLLQLARSQARNTPSTRGTPHMVTEISTGGTRVGRFGWKAQVPTLHQFSGDAYLNEMGITNPEFPDENCPQGDCRALKFNPAPDLNDDGEGVVRFADFMTLLGPPPRGRTTRDTEEGGKVFVSIGCADCHTPTLVTGDSPIQALSHKTFQPFSDFLLHDMGRLGDGIVQGKAGGREFRTAPLWGLSSRPLFLHDGRATSPQAAILAHDGQGARARRRYLDLRQGQQQALLAFLKSL